jgi:DNA-binding response OmpR family regulator
VLDGEEAVVYLAGEGRYADRLRYPLPGLVLLDLKLPRRSGLEVLQWLREQQVLRRLPVVVLSSSREATDIDRAYDLGANSYLVKPVGSDALLGMVRAMDGYWLSHNELPQVQRSGGDTTGRRQA